MFYGDQSLCPAVCTTRGAEPDNPEWNETFEFQIDVADLPRSTKLCFLVYQKMHVGRRSKKVSLVYFANG